MTCSVVVLRSAEREMKPLPRREVGRLLAKVAELAENARPFGSVKLVGSEERYRLRVGRYRVLYRIDETNKRVFVYSVGHRKDVYR